MIRYRQHSYREALPPQQKQLKRQYVALTPQQKQLKRQYKLEQQRQQDYVPSFREVREEVFAVLAPTVLEAYTEGIQSQLTIDDAANEAYRQQIDTTEMTDRELEELGKRLIEEMATKQALQDIEREVKVQYSSITRRLSKLTAQDCWRAIRLSSSENPQQHSDLGVYWTTRKTAAKDYWGDTREGQRVIYRARVDSQQVDQFNTIMANVQPIWGKYEDEVRFFQHAPIYVYDCTLEDGTVVEINDWRTT